MALACYAREVPGCGADKGRFRGFRFGHGDGSLVARFRSEVGCVSSNDLPLRGKDGSRVKADKSLIQPNCGDLLFPGQSHQRPHGDLHPARDGFGGVKPIQVIDDVDFIVFCSRRTRVDQELRLHDVPVGGQWGAATFCRLQRLMTAFSATPSGRTTSACSGTWVCSPVRGQPPGGPF